MQNNRQDLKIERRRLHEHTEKDTIYIGNKGKIEERKKSEREENKRDEKRKNANAYGTDLENGVKIESDRKGTVPEVKTAVPVNIGKKTLTWADVVKEHHD